MRFKKLGRGTLCLDGSTVSGGGIKTRLTNVFTVIGVSRSMET